MKTNQSQSTETTKNVLNKLTVLMAVVYYLEVEGKGEGMMSIPAPGEGGRERVRHVKPILCLLERKNSCPISTSTKAQGFSLKQ